MGKENIPAESGGRLRTRTQMIERMKECGRRSFREVAEPGAEPSVEDSRAEIKRSFEDVEAALREYRAYVERRAESADAEEMHGLDISVSTLVSGVFGGIMIRLEADEADDVD